MGGPVGFFGGGVVRLGLGDTFGEADGDGDAELAAGEGVELGWGLELDEHPAKSTKTRTAA